MSEEVIPKMLIIRMLLGFSFVTHLCVAENDSESPCRDAIRPDNNGTFVCGVGYGLTTDGCRQGDNSAEEDRNSSSSIPRPRFRTVACMACELGISFSDSEDSGGCRRCSKCSNGAIEIAPCNATHNAECRCPRGTFLTEGGDCKQCDLCPHGQGVSKQCTENQNTSCRKCPPGTYSGVFSGTRDCALCTICKEDQLMLQECNSIQDTLCIDKNSHKRHQFPPSDYSRPPSPETGDIVSHYEPEVIPVYCTILIPIFLGLLAYFLLRWRLRRSAKSRRDTSAIFRQDALLLGGMPAPFNARTDQLKLHINHLSSKKRQDVETALNASRQDGKDWRALGKHLGYQAPKIVAFGQQGKATNRGPTYYLLSDWSTRPEATVHLLSQSLAEIGRIDVLWMLQPTCQKMMFPPFAGGEIV